VIAATTGQTLVRNTGIGGSTDSLIGQFNTPNVHFDSVIDALDQNGLVNILAEPNLTAMSGETASFLAGGEFPIPVPQASGTGGAITITYKPFGVALAFTPVVLAGGRISLRVRPEVSQIASTGAVQVNGFSFPSLTTRRAETTIELGSGQTFAIGGLLQNNITDTLSGLPGLKDVPVLGALFRSTQFQRNETELVILVTPYLVRAVSDKRLATPRDGFVPPNDYDMYMRYRQERPSAPGTQPPLGPNGSAAVGPAGFILQ
jgi:pilus assembly protein CpaC